MVLQTFTILMKKCSNLHPITVKDYGYIAGIFILTALLVSGCAPTSSDQQNMTQIDGDIGFLSDYNRLEPFAEDDTAKGWRRDDADWEKFDKILIERMRVMLNAESQKRGIDPTNMKEALDYFYESMVQELEPTVEIVDTTGPGVLRVRIALVNIMTTSVTSSFLGSVIPYGYAAEATAGMAVGRPAGSTPYLGETGIEAQIIDGGSGEIIAEFTDNQVGRKYIVELEEGVTDAATKWAGGYFNSFTAWGYAEGAFDYWAKLFRVQFDGLRGKQ